MGFWAKLFGHSEESRREIHPPRAVDPHRDASITVGTSASLLDNDTPRAWDVLEKTVLPRVAQSLGLDVQRPEDDRMLVRGSLRGVPFRSELTFGITIEHEVRFDNRRGVLSFHWDYDGSVRPFESDPKDPMPERVNRFIAPRIYMQEFPAEADRMTALIEHVPSDFRDDMISVITGGKIWRYEIDSKRAWMRFYLNSHDGITVDQTVALIDRTTRHMGRLAQTFGVGEAAVPSLPRVYVGSRPPAANASNQSICTYCNAVVSLQPGRCDNCGAPITVRSD